MRNLKKFLALVLAMLMVVSAGATVSAYSDVADEDAYAAAIAALTEWGIVNGTELGEAEDGSDALYEPDADVTRWQMALMMARTLAPEVEEEDWAEGMEIFGDVTEWYGAIAYAYVEGIVNGVSTEELVFKPNDGIKYQDGLIMALRALGYDVDVSGVVYWLDAWTQAKQIGLTDGIAITSGAKTMTRAEMAQLIYNMINLPFADGSESLAIKYYGEEAPIGDATTFVITATPGQAYVKGQHTDVTVADGETAATLLGLQKLEAGIPAGDIIYFEAEALGIAADKANDYLHYAVNLYDYDAEYNDFSAVEIVADPVVVRGTAISESGSTIKVNGYTYYLVASLTDAARRNEIVVFTGDADKKDALVLLKNKDGNIVDFNGVIKASYVYTLGATNYYVYQPVEGNPTVISETKALELFGVKTADDAVFTEYETLSAVADSTPYQLSLFDDNGDGKYDRAIYNKVYMSVYNKVDGDGKQVDLGVAGDKAPYNGIKVTFSDTSVQTKGKIFTYTYNPQLKKVNVLETLTKQTGVVTNVNIKDGKVTIGGNTYIVTPDFAKMGVDATVTGTDANGARKWSKIAEGELWFTTLDNFYALGNTYEFYAYGNYIINANKINPVDEDANAKLLVSAGAVGYDSTAIYLEGYVAGSNEKTSIEISVIDADFDANDNIKKDTALADMNIFDLGEYLATVKALFAKGNVFRVVPREDGTYRLLSNKVTSATASDLVNINKYDFIAATSGKYTFKDGNSTADTAVKGQRIRTDANTVFYFVKYDVNGGNIVDLDVTKRAAKDGEFIDTTVAGTYIYTDVLGWGTTKDGNNKADNGVSKVVLVYYSSNAAIKGFDVNETVEYDIVYVTKVDSAKTGYSIVPASEVTTETARNWYYKMADTNAINMVTGEKIATVYATEEVASAGFYKMDANKVITRIADEDLDDYIVHANITSVDLADQYVTLTPAITQANKIGTVYHVHNTEGDVVVGTNNNGDYDLSTEYSIKYLKSTLRNDKVLVAIRCAKITAPTVVTPPAADANANAKYIFTPVGGTAVELKAEVTGIGGTDNKLDAVTIKIYENGAQIKKLSDHINKDSFGRVNVALIQTRNDGKNLIAENAYWTPAIVVDDIKGEISFTITDPKIVTNNAVTLADDEYELRIGFDAAAGATAGTRVVIAKFIVDAQ